MRYYAFLVFLSAQIAIISGCGSFVPVVKMENLSVEQRRAVNDVPIFNQTQVMDKKYKIMNIVEGISCKNKIWDHAATKSDAIFQAKYWAHQMSADGISNLQCDSPRGTTTTYNCWESITCTAEAIKFEK